MEEPLNILQMDSMKADWFKAGAKFELNRILGVAERLEIKDKDEAWNKLCTLSKNDVGLDEGSMILWNAALAKLRDEVGKVDS